MIYFDNASTSKVDDTIVEKLIESYSKNWANPSSLHRLGFESEKTVNWSRKVIADKLRVKEKNIFFVPSGTIANNAVLNSFDIEGKNILVSETEHSSIYYSSLNKKAQVRYVKVDEFGFIDGQDMVKKIDENTVLISFIHVNNELGSINKINDLATIAKEKNPLLKFHSDGIQAFNKVDVSLNNIDFYTISGHKINGPKGAAGLYIKDPATFNNLYYGGKQESSVFSGTENVQAILGFGLASQLDNNYHDIKEINLYLRQEIEKIKDSKIISPDQDYSPFILNVCFKGIGAEILLHYLEMDEIFISTGSACNKGEKSRVLEAIGLDKYYNEGCIRISLSRNSTMGEAKIFIEKLREKLEIIRGIIGWDGY